MTPDRTVFTLDYANEELAGRIERSLRPEIGDIDGDRTTAELAREGATLRVTVVADDLVALRAGHGELCDRVSVALAGHQSGSTGLQQPEPLVVVGPDLPASPHR